MRWQNINGILSRTDLVGQISSIDTTQVIKLPILGGSNNANAWWFCWIPPATHNPQPVFQMTKCHSSLLKRNGSEHTKHFDFGTHFYSLFIFAQLLQRLQPELFPSASFLNTGGISSAAEVFLVLDCGILGLLFNTNLGWSTGCSSTRLPCIKWGPFFTKKR